MLSKLYFPQLSSQECLDRFFEHFFQLFPNFTSLKLQGDDGFHELLFSNMETTSKSIQFLKHVYYNNQELRIRVDSNNQELMIHFLEENHWQILSFPFENTDAIFSMLAPLYIEQNHFYYSAECFTQAIQRPYKKSEDKIAIENWMIESYIFRKELRGFLSKVNFFPKTDSSYQYDFQSFLPEEASKEDLLRILLFTLSQKFESLADLEHLHLQHQIRLDSQFLKSKKELHFSADAIPLSGFINPVEKQIQIDK